jgi:hypothetical protein
MYIIYIHGLKMKDVIIKFDNFLTEKNFSFDVIVIGGAALNIMGVTNRVTRDVDCIDPELSVKIKELSYIFATENYNLGLDPNNWFNNGPISILNDLDKGWESRVVLIFEGSSLNISTLGRIDLLKTKLFAYCDRDIDYDDCVKLNPTIQELNECQKWVKDRDANDLWPSHVDNCFKLIAKGLGYE